MEIKIILILLVIHLLGLILIKPKNNILSCGIFGWAGKSAKSFDKAKFDIQGIYNDSRGGDSCGVSTDGEIYYGVSFSKKYIDFLSKQSYKTPLLIPTIIGHTRKSSSGAVNADNAHPFGFGDYQDSFEFIGVHNGTLHNENELAINYGIETTVKEANNFGNKTIKRNKIDSEILLEIIYKSKNFKVLSDYIGGAALLFTNTLEPNVLYAFKGASRADSYDKGLDVDERPLFYYKESKNSLYISSIQASLEAIGGVQNENLFSFLPNTIYKITDGNISSAEIITISRRDAHQRPEIIKKYNCYNNCGYELQKNKMYTESEDVYKNGEKQKEGLIRIQEEKEQRIFKSPILFNKLRYYRSGHLLNGICLWIKEYGFCLLSKEIESAEKQLIKSIGCGFDLEYGYFVENLSESNPEDTQYTIFPFTDKNKVKPSLFYFHEGIMLDTKLDYSMLYNNKKIFDIWALSEMSKHPIIDMNKQNFSKYNYILHKRSLFSGNICPLGSSKIYYIEKGVLTKCHSLERETIVDDFSAIDKYNNTKNEICLDPTLFNKESIFPQDKYNVDDEESITNFNDILKVNKIEITSEKDFEDNQLNLKNKNTELIEYEVTEIMVPIYIQIQESITELSMYEEEKFIDEIIELNEEYIQSLDEIIEKIYK